MSRKKAGRIFAGVIIGLGICSVAYIAARANFFRLNYWFLLLGIFAVALRSRDNGASNELKPHVVVANSFIFLGFLLYGGATAVIIAGAGALISAIRFADKKLVIAFQTALAVLATFVPALLVKQIIYPSIIDEIHNGNYGNLAIAIGILSTVQFLITTVANSLFDALNDDEPFATVSRLWSAIAYAVGGVVAGLLAVLIDEIGFQVLFSTIPIMIFVYLTNRIYLKNVEISRAKAEESARYAETLELQAQALRESEERFRTAFDHAPIGIALVARDGRLQKVNHAFSGIFACDADDVIRRDIRELIHPDDQAEIDARLNDVANRTISSFQSETKCIDRKGETIWVALSVSDIGDREIHSNLIFQLQDITAKRLADEKLVFAATHDALTGLPNRAFFTSKLESALDTCIQNPENCSNYVLFIDLDGFKSVNDKYGHSTGDELLVEIAFRLRKALRPSDVLARLAGDEFTALIEDCDPDSIVSIAQRIENQFSEVFHIAGCSIESSASVGILKIGQEHTSSFEVLRDADIAMYRAKTSGRARYEFFDPTIFDGPGVSDIAQIQ